MMGYEHFEDFSAEISGLYRRIQKLKDYYRNREGVDVKSVHILWLYLLQQYPQGLYASELAQKSRANRSLVSREIQALVDKQLITAEQKADTRRYGARFVLTESGMAVAQRIQSIALEIQECVSEGIKPEELEVFYRVLYQLNHNFQQVVTRFNHTER